MRQTLSALFRCSRPSFLLLTPCCLSVAVAFIIAEGISFDGLTLSLMFAGALSAHISVNQLNEYYDFRSGLDLHTRRTPFSGGSGALPAAPDCAERVKQSGLLCLLVTIMIGLYFVWRGAWGLLPLGLVGVLLVYGYSPYITERPWLCLLAPGIGFGPVMILGAYTLLNGQQPAAVFVVSLVIMLIVSNLLLLNQFPDLEADREAGRRHLLILIGRQNSAWVYVALLLLAYALVLLSVFTGLLPTTGLLSLITLPAAIPAAMLALKYHDDMERLTPVLGLNVVLTLSLPVMLALGLVWESLPPWTN
ncbi:prenyltransferase [Methylomarinum sp. Ch1-1]|uniref:Prenyltransferase n=1 Tax=Methylomarinum roseum TaxID=3067653 RepID=A0AAU7NWS3_9GAMM|nr:prenyltransferase [Methylomarinum sp. Ch1-1]MDP4522489.1 prenyltransferase [Methylomarinum sp. Ch1-1]